MTIETALAELAQQFTQTTILGQDWLIHLLFTTFTVLIISTDPEDWKELLLPVMLLWSAIGLNANILFFLPAGALFITSIFSVRQLSQLWTATTQTSTGLGQQAINYQLPTQKMKDLEFNQQMKQEFGDILQTFDEPKTMKTKFKEAFRKAK